MDCKKYYVYILLCSDNTLYTGYTTDIKRRFIVHNKKKGAKYTKNRTPVILKYFEEFDDKSSALKKEHLIKKLKKSEKINYIKLNTTEDKEVFIRSINQEEV